MAKFVLIDPSIRDVGGHYYEYAVRVLRAAEEAGFESILATNRDLKQIETLPWRVVPAYRYDFFQPGRPRLLVAVRQRLSDLRRHVARLKHRLLFSQFGVLWSKRRERPSLFVATFSSRRLMVAAAVVECLLYIARLTLAMGRLLLAMVPVGGYLSSVGRAARHVLAAAMRPVRSLAVHRALVWHQLHTWRKRTAFSADSLRLFRQVRLEHDDVVFIPTLTEADMLGLLSLFRANQETTRATWHLVFRRNIYHGREPDYAGQEETLRPLRNAFRQFQAQLRGQRVSFYTDTEELTVQYNRLGVASFQTVPIPVATDYRAPANVRTLARPVPTQTDPLHVVYIGDARSEKGYQWLPHLVGDAIADDLPARFTFQSNFNVPGGEPAPAVARAQLEALPPQHRVELLKHPLASDAYRQLLFEADAVVIPYERDNYYARSSGIFAEALVAGKPVIVPAGTWMASALASSIFDYHQAVRRDQRVLKSFQSRDLVWKTLSGRVSDARGFVADGCLPILGKPPTSCWLKIPEEATHLLVSFKVDGNGRGVFPGITLDRFGRGRALLSRTIAIAGGTQDQQASAMVHIEGGARRIRLGLSNGLSTLPIVLSEVRVDLLSAPHGLALSTIGATYADPGELSRYVREILTHYEHYRTTAIDFSRRWAAYHCPEMLLEQLIGAKGGSHSREAAAAQREFALDSIGSAESLGKAA